jgi:hypothetical protein
MSGSFSTWLETQLLGHTFGGVPYAMPAGLYVGLYIALPTQDGGGTEVAVAGYVRMPVTFGPIAGSPPSMSNTAALQWAPAQQDWGTVVAAGIFDALAAGNMLGSAALADPTNPTTPAPKPITQGDIFRIPAANLIVGFALPAPSVPMGTLSRVRLRSAEVVA